MRFESGLKGRPVGGSVQFESGLKKHPHPKVLLDAQKDLEEAPPLDQRKCEGCHTAMRPMESAARQSRVGRRRRMHSLHEDTRNTFHSHISRVHTTHHTHCYGLYSPFQQVVPGQS